MFWLVLAFYLVVVAGAIVTLGATDWFGVEERDGEHGLMTLAIFLWPVALPAAVAVFSTIRAFTWLIKLGKSIRKKIRQGSD